MALPNSDETLAKGFYRFEGLLSPSPWKSSKARVSNSSGPKVQSRFIGWMHSAWPAWIWIRLRPMDPSHAKSRPCSTCCDQSRIVPHDPVWDPRCTCCLPCTSQDRCQVWCMTQTAQGRHCAAQVLGQVLRVAWAQSDICCVWLVGQPQTHRQHWGLDDGTPQVASLTPLL